MAVSRTPYQVCVECETTYATAEDLLHGHARNDDGIPHPRWLLFCAECLHDFAFRPGGQVDLTGHAAVIAESLRRDGFGQGQPVNRLVLDLADAVDEFVDAYRRWSGQARRSGTADATYEELAKVIITAFVTAHELGIEINTVLAAKLHKVRTRGWLENAECGQPHPRLAVRCDWPAGHQTSRSTHCNQAQGIWWNSDTEFEGDVA